MRLNAPVPIIGRRTTKDFDLDGFLCPKGTDISVFIHQLHTNSVVWGDDALVRISPLLGILVTLHAALFVKFY